MPRKASMPDLPLLVASVLLVAIGVAAVYSASAVWGEYRFQDSFFFAKRQLLFASLGFLAMAAVVKIDYWTWRHWSVLLLATCFLLLLLVLIPGVGLVRGGARSWLGVGAFSIQPSEFMKLGLIIYLAGFLAKHQKRLTRFKDGILMPLLLIFAAFAMIMLQPDLGTGAVLVATCVLMIFVAGAPIRYFVWLGIVGLAGFAALIASAPYRIKRITSFLDPWQDPLGSGFQIIQSLYAIGPGGLFGLGYGDSKQKYFYLPEPQTDFIFAIIAEEGGFIAGCFVLLLFAIVMWRGIKIALSAPDLFGSLLAVGIVGMIIIQVMINIGVVIGLFPVTGITLPFLSYGGSSLTLMLLAIGILLNISTHIRYY